MTKKNEKVHFSPNEICIIDVEATGLSPDSHPIEIAFLSLTDEEDSFLINPESVNHWTHWDGNAQDVHGISREECVENGISVYEAAQRLNNQLRGCLLISDAAGFDGWWIDVLFEAADLEQEFNVIDLADFVFGTGQDPAKMNEFFKFKEENTIPHRALADCKIIKDSAIKAGIFKEKYE